MGRKVIPIKSMAQSVAKSMQKKGGKSYINDLPPIDMSKSVSTGSLLLDLTISGKRMEWGGVPGGILVEIFGPSGSGKTAIMAELCGSAQNKGWEAEIMDPEARFDEEYSRIYGVKINPKIYSQPDTIPEVFNKIWKAQKKDNNQIKVFGVDSLAALSTNLEMGGEDKMGMRRAKEFSENLRKTCRIIRKNNCLVACTNQIRQSEYGERTPGGEAVPFYSSLRLRVYPWKSQRDSLIVKERELFDKTHKKIIGIKSSVYVKKSSVDDPYRECYIYIIFGYGIHDIMTNIQYLKDTMGLSMFPAVDMEYKGLDQAVAHIEKYSLELPLREEVKRVWNEVEEKFKINRKPKVRF